MNENLPDDDPTIIYNDSDYPSKDHGRFPENFDETTKQQGVAFDVDRYVEIAEQVGAPVLEIGCGSGRIGIAMARAGIENWGIDISAGMISRYREKLKAEATKLTEMVTLTEADATNFTLDRKDFPLAIIPFNTLLCIHEFEKQQETLNQICKHLKPGGQLIIDVISPHKIQLFGNETPRAFFTRRNVWTGQTYTRFAAASPLNEKQQQRLYGWYDELREDHTVERRPYSFFLRPLYRYELMLMLEKAGFAIEKIEGDHHGSTFTNDSPKMFVLAKKVSHSLA